MYYNRKSKEIMHNYHYIIPNLQYKCSNKCQFIIIITIMMSTHTFVERLSQKQILDLEQLPKILQQFISIHHKKTITFLTSGGTSVPLQKKSVRFIQNFSTGLRGSLLAEELIKKQQPVIFFYRQNSHLPFTHGMSLNSILLAQNNQGIQSIVKAYQQLADHRKYLLLLPFKTIYYYLNGLILFKNILPKGSILLLCAAVSDFIPKQESSHKIHTCQELNLQLINSPKILGSLTGIDHLCVSFKLQTDPNKLNERVQFAIQKYGIDMVIGNCLGNKKWVNVTYNSQFCNKTTEIFESQKQSEVESHIINKVLQAQKYKFAQIK